MLDLELMLDRLFIFNFSMHLVKYISIRILLIALLVVIANFLYRISFYKKDVAKHGDILENLWVVPSDTEAIYFGESSNFHESPGDTMKYRISGIIDTMVPQLKVHHVDNSGLHAGTYLAVMKNIPKDSKVNIFIITMNLRSFGAGWRYAGNGAENYLAKTERMLSPTLPIINRFMVSLKAYDYKSDHERENQVHEAWQKDTFNIPEFDYHTTHSWDSAMAWETWLTSNPNLTKENIPIAAQYIKSFSFIIDTNTNERIHDFDAIMELAKKRRYTIYFNILGENVEEAEKLVGKKLIYLIEKNTQFLINRYSKKGAIVVNNLHAVPDSCFVDRDFPTEHYNFTGKRIIAKQVADQIKRNL